jgi:hypothetical protein
MSASIREIDKQENRLWNSTLSKMGGAWVYFILRVRAVHVDAHCPRFVYSHIARMPQAALLVLDRQGRPYLPIQAKQ